MKAGLAWLGDFADISDLTPAQVANKLTMIGLEVEDIFDRLAHLDQAVCGRAEEVRRHGEHLWHCTVSLGSRSLSVLTGAPNVRAGGLYALAPAGTELPGGPVRVKTLAGLKSEAVLCSAAELGLPGGGDRLLELPETASPGESLRHVYPQTDPVLDISITPNRADALSILGIARDLSAVLNRPLKEKPVRIIQGSRAAKDQAEVSIECPDHCWRYCGRVINNVRIGPSPDWLAARLMGAGLRSINNVVDVTNYIMLE
ncbi:MAG: phenylalanine--tRNA ligase subunit beta, partial [Deltaproteobacteria bacterium]|nr:phenylalanine--tRNA ligase subunit beta [Deltaproteobacteria bacterium]